MRKKDRKIDNNIRENWQRKNERKMRGGRDNVAYRHSKTDSGTKDVKRGESGNSQGSKSSSKTEVGRS